MYNFTKSQHFLYWAIFGLILEAKRDAGNSVVIELAKRIISKLDIPSPDSKLMLEYKHINLLINELATDHSGVLKSLDMDAQFNPSDYIQLKIGSNMNLKKYEEAKYLCISELTSSSHFDSRIWLSFLEILKNIGDGPSIAKQTLNSLEEKIDSRGFKCAVLELKLSFESSFPESAAEILFNFSVSLSQKPSTLNDVIFFLKKFQTDEIIDFYSKITNYINSVGYIKFIINLNLIWYFSLHQRSILLKNHYSSIYIAI